MLFSHGKYTNSHHIQAGLGPLPNLIKNLDGISMDGNTTTPLTQPPTCSTTWTLERSFPTLAS